MKVAVLATDTREHFKDYANPTPNFGTAPQALLQGFAALPELEVHVISCAQKPMRSPEKIAPNIWFHSLHVPKIGWMRTGYQGCIRAIRRALRSIKPNLVHGQGTERECAIGAVLSGFPNVITVHGNMRLIAQVNKARPFSFGWLAARLERFTLPRSVGVVCITNYTRDAVLGLARRTWVIPNAVDASFFEVNPKLPQDGVPKILCVGHVWPRKNQNAFIRALDPLAEKAKFRLVFLGQTNSGRAYDDEFLSLVRARAWCEQPGFADREALKKELLSASLLALPSLEDNCPMVVLEAMAAGVPVVAAKVGGLPDLIEEDVTGWFCDPLSAESMRRAVQGALANPAAAAEMAARAKARARQKFHPEIIGRRHLQIYQEVVTTPS